MGDKNYLSELKVGLLSIVKPPPDSGQESIANFKLPGDLTNKALNEPAANYLEENGDITQFKKAIRNINPAKIPLPFQSGFLVKLIKTKEQGIFITYTTGLEPNIVKYCFKTGQVLVNKAMTLTDYTKLLVSPDETFLLICRTDSLHIMDLTTLEIVSTWEFKDVKIIKTTITVNSDKIHIFNNKNFLICLNIKTKEMTEIMDFEGYTLIHLLRSYCMIYKGNTIYSYNMYSRSITNSVEIDKNIESITIHSNFKNSLGIFYDPVDNVATIRLLSNFEVLNHYYIDSRITKAVFARNDQTIIVLYENGKLAFFSIRMYDKPDAFSPSIKIFRGFFHFNQLTNEFYTNDELFDTYRWNYLDNKLAVVPRHKNSILRPVGNKIYELVEDQLRIIKAQNQELEDTIQIQDATRFEYKRNAYESYILVYHGSQGLSIRDPTTLALRSYITISGEVSNATKLPGTDILVCIENDNLRFYDTISGALHHIIPSAHILNINDILTTNSNMFITSSLDKTVRLWKYADQVPCCINKLVYEDLEFTCLGLDRKEEYFLAGSIQGKVVFWNIYNLLVAKVFQFNSEIVKISISKNSFHFFIGEKNGLITVGYLPTLTLITVIETDLELDYFFLDDDEKFIYAFSEEISKRFKNPLTANSVTIYGSTPGKSRYYSILNDLCIHGRDIPHDPEFDKLLFSPGGINSLHIYTYFGMAKHLKKCLRENIVLIPDRDGVTPIDMCLDIKDTEMLGIFLDALIRQIPKNKHLANVLENCIIKINQTGHPILDDLYRVLFRTCLDTGIPRFCDDSLNLPIRVFSTSKSIKLKDFSKEESSFETKKQMICFKETLIPLNYNFGSAESIEFLKSLYECSNEEIFRTPLVQEYLTSKWLTARKFIAIQGLIYTFYMISILKHLFYENYYFDIWFIFTMNFIIILFELFQMVTNRWEYWRDSWNYLDMVRNVLCTIYIIDISMNESQNKYSILELLSLVSFIRGVAYFRLFKDTRYLINLLFEVIKDIRAFMALLIYAIFTNLVLVYIFTIKNGNKFEWDEGLMNTYNLLFGGMDKPSDLVHWVILTLNMMIIPIIILNLLISILGDTYDRVQSSSAIADMKEILEMIIEVEQLFFLRKGLKDRCYFQMCIEKEMLESSENAWEGRIRQMDKKMNHMKHSLSTIINILKNKQSDTSNIMSQLSQKLISQEAMFRLITENQSLEEYTPQVTNYKTKLRMKAKQFSLGPRIATEELKTDRSYDSEGNTKRD